MTSILMIGESDPDDINLFCRNIHSRYDIHITGLYMKKVELFLNTTLH